MRINHAYRNALIKPSYQCFSNSKDVSADSGVFDQLFGESAIDHDAISYVRDAGMIFSSTTFGIFNS